MSFLERERASIKMVFTEIFIIVLSICFTLLLYPLLFVFLLPCWIYKKLVKTFARKNSSFGNILDGPTGVLAAQDPYHKPGIILVPYFTLADKLDVPKVVDVIKENIIKPGLYPELRQKIVRKYGYHFWYFVDNFKVEDHVRYLKPECPNSPVTRQELREITAGLVKLPFHPEKSPWEVLIAPNYICDRDPEEKSVFILRVNHCLMDGYAVVNFVSRCATKPWIHKLGGGFQNKSFSINLFHRFYFNTLLFLTGPYHLLKILGFYSDKHEFIVNVHKPGFEDKWHSQITRTICSSRLKAVTRTYNIGMSSLITTLLVQALYKVMTRNKLSAISNYIHGYTAYPLPRHPGSMTNHWSLVRTPFKVNLKDASETLKFVDNEYQKLRSSVVPLVVPIFNKLITILPLCVRPVLNSVTPTAFVLTNFPGPTEPCDIFGCRANQAILYANIYNGIGAKFSSLSWSGNFWFDAGLPVCDAATQEDADYLSDAILETLNDLEKIKKHV